MTLSNPGTASYPGEQLAFWAAPSLNVKWPKPNTLPDQVLARMLAGERLTQPKFGLNHWRLSAYIKALEYLGWPIERMDVAAPADCAVGRHIREYWLSPATIAAAKECSHA